MLFMSWATMFCLRLVLVLVITQNGEAAMVIEGVQQYQDKEDLIALLKLLALGEKDRQAGLGLSVQEARAQLAQRRQAAQPQA